jgi:hypothetical protein
LSADKYIAFINGKIGFAMSVANAESVEIEVDGETYLASYIVWKDVVLLNIRRKRNLHKSATYQQISARI